MLYIWLGEENMVLVKVNELKTGMVLAKDIYHLNSSILLAEGTELQNTFITKLKDSGISEVYIQDLRINVEVDDLVSEEVKQRTATIMSRAIKSIPEGLKDDFPEIEKMVSEILDELLLNDDIIIQLSNIRAIGDYTLNHSINVCVYSIITALTMNYEKRELLELGVGALLHDIGKIMIPNSLLNKPDRLNDEEYEIVKDHTIRGYEILKQIDGISERARRIALLHHERMDGKGYPTGVFGNDIDEFVKIVSVVDVFDALTSDRIYREKIESHLALEYLISMSKIQFDYETVRHFVQNVAIYPIGTGVSLSSGEIGIVRRVNKEFPTRPYIRVIKDKHGNSMQTPKDYDLMKELSIFIMKRIDIV
jgi:putative nucleotidyltransferase with HDIG domain